MQGTVIPIHCSWMLQNKIVEYCWHIWSIIHQQHSVCNPIRIVATYPKVGINNHWFIKSFSHNLQLSLFFIISNNLICLANSHISLSFSDPLTLTKLFLGAKCFLSSSWLRAFLVHPTSRPLSLSPSHNTLKSIVGGKPK